MNNLERKFKEYIYTHLAFPKSTPLDKAARDLAEITEKELKKQLDNMEYLDRKEVEKIFLEINIFEATSHMKAIDKICNLAINKDAIRKRIVEVLERWINFNNLESIATEILEGKEVKNER